MSSDGNSRVSKGGVLSSLRLLIGGKPDESSEPEEEAGTDELSLEDAAVADDWTEAVPVGDATHAAPSTDDKGTDGDDDGLILDLMMPQRVAADEDFRGDQSGEEKGEGQHGDEIAAGCKIAAGAEDVTGDDEADGDEDAPPSAAVPEEAVEASAEAIAADEDDDMDDDRETDDDVLILGPWTPA